MEKEPRNGWARVAALVRRRSRAIVFCVFGLLIVLALGNLTHHGTIGFGQGETRPTNSSRGTAVLDEHFPPGHRLAADRGRQGRARWRRWWRG